MGAFAEKKINDILSKLRSEKKINDKEVKIINCIGDDLIRDKLLELYEKNQGIHYTERNNDFAENTMIDNSIAILRSQVEELLKTIEQLEQMKHD